MAFYYRQLHIAYAAFSKTRCELIFAFGIQMAVSGPIMKFSKISVLQIIGFGISTVPMIAEVESIANPVPVS